MANFTKKEVLEAFEKNESVYWIINDIVNEYAKDVGAKEEFFKCLDAFYRGVKNRTINQIIGKAEEVRGWN